MLDLPIELWHDIMSRLNAEDLISCSQVSEKWKEIVNSNALWKPICLQKGWTKIYVQLSGFSQNEVCLWWRIYQSNYELYRRWRYKLWVRHSLASKGQQGEVFALNSDSTYLAVGYQKGDVILWNISSKPSIITIINCLLPNYPVLEVKVSSNWVAVLQDRLLQVYKVNCEDYSLSRVVSLDLGPNHYDLTSLCRSFGSYFHSWYRECLRVVDMNPLRRLLMTLSGSVLAVGLGEQNNVYVFDLKFNNPSNDVCLEAKVKDLLSCEESVYIVTWVNRRTKIFFHSDMKTAKELINSPSRCRAVISEKFILTVPEECGFTLQKLRVWLRKDGVCISSRMVSSSGIQACVTDSNIVIYSEGDEIWIWDPVRDSILRKIIMGFPINVLEARFSDFLVVLLDSVVYVYNWKNGVELYSISAKLEWSGDYINLIWICPTAIVAGGINNQPELLSFA